MKKVKTVYVGFYNEAMIQLGFIVFFAPTFPLAPLFSFLTNLLEINIKLSAMTESSRRFLAQGAQGIGSWLDIMEFMSFVCIPINIGIIYFAADGPKTESHFVKSIRGEGDSWSDARIILLIVGIEHLIMAFKALVAVAIPDVPEIVIHAENKREI